MGFLRILGLGRVFARHAGQVFRAIFLLDHAAGAGDCLGCHVDAVGAHIGNGTILVETLRDLHGARGRKAELARGFLLQGRGGEGRVGVALGGLGFHGGDVEGRGIERGLESTRFRFGADVEAADLAAVGADEPRRERRAVLRLQEGGERPIFPRPEFLDFQLAVADEAQGHRLHAAGRFRAGQLAPQHRRQVEADEIIERPAGEIGIDQRGVDLAWRLHGFQNGALGDRIEHHALDMLVLEHLLALQHFQHMPGNGLALAIRIGCENDLVGILHGGGDIGEALGRLGVDLPEHGEIRLGIDGAILGRQVAHVPERGVDLVIGPEIFVDRLGLGRRLDDDNVHENTLKFNGLVFEGGSCDPSSRAPGGQAGGAKHGGATPACQMGLRAAAPELDPSGGLPASARTIRRGLETFCEWSMPGQSPELPWLPYPPGLSNVSSPSGCEPSFARVKPASLSARW